MDIAIYPAEVLRRVASPVEAFDDGVKELVRDMIQTMHDAKGIGLAAPQVGISLRLFVVQLPEMSSASAFINPRILSTSRTQDAMEEGCLSIPAVYASVTRPVSIGLRAQNEEGKSFFLETEGLFARAILHEYDHLEGTLFVDYLGEKERSALLSEYHAAQDS